VSDFRSTIPANCLCFVKLSVRRFSDTLVAIANAAAHLLHNWQLLKLALRALCNPNSN
jgi:hypothetical protein